MKLSHFMAFAVVALLLYSCSSNSQLDGEQGFMGDVRIEFQDLPPDAQEYINQNYPDAEVRWIKMDDDGDTQYFYEVKLKNGREIYFNELGELVEDGFDLFDDDDINIDPATLPQVIQDYVAANYPGVAILRAEMEEDDDEPYRYEVYLVNGVELYFDANGNLVAKDNDDDNLSHDDDLQIDPSTLPQVILDYISTNYPGVSILHAEMEEDDDEPYKYEVTLANGIELYFDAAGNLVKVDDD